MAVVHPDPTLPTELLQAIALILYEERRNDKARCNNADLLSFSKASRHFYQIALPLIFREVCLQDVGQAVCCLQTILSNDLAAISIKRFAVLGLDICPSSIVAKQPVVSGLDVSRALERMPDLLTLRIEPSLTSMDALFEKCGIEGWEEIVQEIFIAKGANAYPFRLTTFVTNLPPDGCLKSFLVQQDGILNMSYRKQLPWADWNRAPLPALRELSISAYEQPPIFIKKLLDGKRLEHLFIDTLPYGNQPISLESRFIMELRPRLMPMILQQESLETFTLRAKLSDMLKLLTSRGPGDASSYTSPRRPIHISCLLDSTKEYTRNADFYVVITMIIVSLASGRFTPLKTLLFNFVPLKEFAEIHAIVSNVSPSYVKKEESFSTYFYDQHTRVAKRLYIKNFTPALEWVYERIPFDDIPTIPGAVFDWKADERWQRYPEGECNLALG